MSETDEETTIINVHNMGANVHVGDHNVMYVRCRGAERKSLKQSIDKSQSSGSCSSGHLNQDSASTLSSKTSATKKIVVPDRLVDQGVMVTVAHDLGSDWEQLAKQLQVRDPLIGSYKVDFDTQGVAEMAYQMLRDWREMKGPEAEILVLAKALVKIKRPDIAVKLASNASMNQ